MSKDKSKIILLWSLFAILLMSIPIGVWFQNKNAPQSPPNLSSIPEFELRDQLDQSFSRNDLKQKIWVANFIFTSCAHTCPRLTEKMEKLGNTLKEKNLDEIQFLSFTVDPQNDTPERLLEYSQNYNANPKRWKFLTGDSKSIENTVINGFKISLGKVTSKENPHIFEIIHGDRFVLIDQNQNIRGYFDVSNSDNDEFKEIITAIQYLAKNQPRIARQ